MGLIANSITPERTTPRINVAAIPGELKARGQWVVWRRVVRKDKGTKVPFRSLLPHQEADTTDPATWSTFEEALDALADPRNRLDGIGFVFAPDDAYAGVDLDNCLDEEGTMQAWARAVLDRLPGYAEISPSARGVKLFVVGSVPFGKGRKVQKLGDGSGAIECYDRGRYFTVTGYLFEPGHRELVDARDALSEMHAAYFPPVADRPRHEPGPPTLDDAAIVLKLQTDRRAAEFDRLWAGDISGFPSKSEADLSLCSRIAFYTQDEQAIARIFGQSGMVDSKWSEREDYRKRTIDKALHRTTIHDANYNQSTSANSAQNPENPIYSPDDPADDQGEGNKKYSKYKNKSSRESTARAREAEDEAEESPEDAHDPSAWPPPRLDGPEPSPAFPLEALPGSLRDLLGAVAESMACPVDFPALAALGLASGAMGRTVAIRVKEGWIETPGLYGAIVGHPGMTKSPPLAMLSRPLWDLHYSQQADYKRRIDEHEVHGKKGDPEPDPPRSIIVDEVTVERLAEILAGNPHGVVMVKDELSGLFGGMNQYKAGGKGNDRQFYLSAWSGSSVAVDRKHSPDRRSVTVQHPFLSVVGGLTPDMLSELGEGKGRDDGFLDRVLFAAPDRIRIRWSDRGVPPELLRDWSAVIERLWAEPMAIDERGRPRPWFVSFEADAYDSYRGWFDYHEEEAEGDDFPAYLRGPWAKFRAYGARLSLLTDRIDRAYRDGLRGCPQDVGPEALSRGIILTEYFKAQARRVRGMMRGTFGDCPPARKVVDWIHRKRLARFKAAEVRQNFRQTFPPDGPELDRAMAWLVGRHCIRPVLAAREKPGPGRPASVEYEVNPALLGDMPAAD